MGTMGDSTKRRMAAAIQGGAGLGGTRTGFNPGASVGGYAGGMGGTFGKAGRGLDPSLDVGVAGAAASGSPARCGVLHGANACRHLRMHKARLGYRHLGNHAPETSLSLSLSLSLGIAVVGLHQPDGPRPLSAGEGDPLPRSGWAETPQGEAETQSHGTSLTVRCPAMSVLSRGLHPRSPSQSGNITRSCRRRHRLGQLQVSSVSVHLHL